MRQGVYIAGCLLLLGPIACQRSNEGAPLRQATVSNKAMKVMSPNGDIFLGEKKSKVLAKLTKEKGTLEQRSLLLNLPKSESYIWVSLSKDTQVECSFVNEELSAISYRRDQGDIHQDLNFKYDAALPEPNVAISQDNGKVGKIWLSNDSGRVGIYGSGPSILWADNRKPRHSGIGRTVAQPAMTRPIEQGRPTPTGESRLSGWRRCT